MISAGMAGHALRAYGYVIAWQRMSQAEEA